MDFANDNPYAAGIPVINAAVEERSSFLRKVAGLTFVGLVIGGVGATIMSVLIVLAPELMLNRMVSMVVIFGAMFGAQGIGAAMRRTDSSSMKMMGFAAGTGLEGFALGYVVFTAAMVSMGSFGNPFVLIGEAAFLVGLTVVGMCAYLMTGPKNLSLIGAGLSMMTLPMLALMALSFIFPINGVMGIALNALFILTSGGSLLYGLNQVMHKFRANQAVDGAYFLALGIMIFFWNVLTLLTRMNRN